MTREVKTLKRKFGGKVYKHYVGIDYAPGKKKAMEGAKFYRDTGEFARIVKIKGGYQIFHRDK